MQADQLLVLWTPNLKKFREEINDNEGKKNTKSNLPLQFILQWWLLYHDDDDINDD